MPQKYEDRNRPTARTLSRCMGSADPCALDPWFSMQWVNKNKWAMWGGDKLQCTFLMHPRPKGRGPSVWTAYPAGDRVPDAKRTGWAHYTFPHLTWAIQAAIMRANDFGLVMLDNLGVADVYHPRILALQEVGRDCGDSLAAFIRSHAEIVTNGITCIAPGLAGDNLTAMLRILKVDEYAITNIHLKPSAVGRLNPLTEYHAIMANLWVEAKGRAGPFWQWMLPPHARRLKRIIMSA